MFRDLMSEKLPRLHAHFEQHKVDFSLITFNWFLVVFVDSVVSDILFKIWDAFLFEGPKVRSRTVRTCLQLSLVLSQAVWNEFSGRWRNNLTRRLPDLTPAECELLQTACSQEVQVQPPEIPIRLAFLTPKLSFTHQKKAGPLASLAAAVRSLVCLRPVLLHSFTCFPFFAQIIFRFALSLFKYKEEEFLKLQDSTALFKYLRYFTRTILDSRYTNMPVE